MTSLLDAAIDSFLPAALKEKRREANNEDENFLLGGLYFFQLDIPAAALGGSPEGGGEPVTMTFPLVIAPENITVSDPFAVTTTPTVAGGLFVEENGILARSIRIEGTTGFKPRRRYGWNEFSDKSNAESSFEPRGAPNARELSGQRHFHFLQDRVFRTYGDLKRDPATAKETRMFFHNTHDSEHWAVIPIRFDMRRTVGRKFLYSYAIELLAVEKGLGESLEESEDKSWLDKAKDVINDIRGAVAMVVATINEVTKFVKEIEQFVSGVIELFGTIADVINAVSDFVDGVASFIAAPFRAIADVTNGIDSACERFTALPDSFRDTVTHAFRQMGDAFDAIGSHKEVFATPTQTKLDKVNSLRTLNGVSSDALAQAAARSAKNARDYARRGTAPLPGDQQRARGDRSPAPTSTSFNSATERIVGSTDTLQSLAARFLGDARKWRLIAALNGLHAPYISETPLPFTVRTGDKILIPSQAPPPAARPDTGVLGAGLELPLAEQLLGADYLLVPISGRRDLYDRVVDEAKGKTDFKTVRGVANLEQAVRTRVITERGTNSLYRRLGLKRLVGIGIPAVDQEIVRLQFRDAITADPRIAKVVNVRFLATASPDTVDIELDAQVRGFNEPITVRVPRAA